MKYSIHSTKEDYKKMYNQLEELSEKLNMPLDWKKIKRASLDSLSPLPSILQRKLDKQNKMENLKVIRTNFKDIDSVNIEVLEGDILIAQGSYNIRTNWAHLEVEDKFMEKYDDAELVDKIESRELQITN